MAQITITLDSEAEAIEVLSLLKTMKSASGAAVPNPEVASDSGETEKKAPAKKTAAKEKKSAAKEDPLSESEAPTISLTDVRAAALKLSKAGKQKQLKEIFAKYDAEKLSDIDAENYESLMADLEAANE